MINSKIFVIISILILLLISQEIDIQTYKNQLLQIDNRIVNKLKKNRQVSIEKSRNVQQIAINKIYQNNIKINQQSRNKLSIIDSISYVNKNSMIYSFLLTNSNNYFTIDGDFILNFTNQLLFYYGNKNQISLFVKKSIESSTIKINQLKFINKKPLLEQLIQIKLTQPIQQYIDFIQYSKSGNKNYVFSNKNGYIEIYNKNGQKEINIKFNSYSYHENQFIYFKRIANQLIVYSKKDIKILELNGNYSIFKNCTLPYENNQHILSDSSHSKQFYLKTSNHLYIYEIYPYCKPTLMYQIPPKAQLHLMNQIIFILVDNISYYINRTDNKIYHFEIPLVECLGQTSIQISQKNQNNYILAHLCRTSKSQVINYRNSYYQLQLSNSSSQGLDFSKFRIPFILFSFGVIIFVSVRRKKSSETLNLGQKEQVEDKQFQNIINRMSKKQ